MYFVITNRVFCAAVLSATASVHAATFEQSRESENIVKTDDVIREVAEYDKEINDDFVDVLQDDSKSNEEGHEQQTGDYKITRKVRPDNPVSVSQMSIITRPVGMIIRRYI